MGVPIFALATDERAGRIFRDAEFFGAAKHLRFRRRAIAGRIFRPPVNSAARQS